MYIKRANSSRVWLSRLVIRCSKLRAHDSNRPWMRRQTARHDNAMPKGCRAVATFFTSNHFSFFILHFSFFAFHFLRLFCSFRPVLAAMRGGEAPSQQLSSQLVIRGGAACPRTSFNGKPKAAASASTVAFALFTVRLDIDRTHDQEI